MQVRSSTKAAILAQVGEPVAHFVDGPLDDVT